LSTLLPSPPLGRDYYTEFIEGSRWLKKEQADARTAWFEDLPWEHKETTLFRFEMLLKGLVCFRNPVNHPGPPLGEDMVMGREFNAELVLVRSMMRNIAETGRVLIGKKDHSFVFKRYLESVLVQDHARARLAKTALAQDTPEQSLTLLVEALKDHLDVMEGLFPTSHVSFRLFSSVIKLVQREINRSEYFDPLASFEFRSEFDRIKNVEVLEVIANIESDPSRRVGALAFLSLFRMMRYLDLIAQEQAEGSSMGPLFAFLALFRSDAGALASFLRKDAASWISDGFGRLYESYQPEMISRRFDNLIVEFDKLKSLRELLGSMGNQLELELRKMYEYHIPALETVKSKDDLSLCILQATGSLRSFVQNSIVLIAREFFPKVEGERLFVDFSSDRARSERLRRDIWMFQQILRAFMAKAKGSVGVTDQWAGMSTFRFVKEFVDYFKSMGYQLLRYSDYTRFDNFMSLVNRLRDGDVLEVQRLSLVVSECEDFQAFLGQMFDAVSRREELAGEPFDRKDAARTLKLFLGL
jgi:hypothetical protein